MSISGIALAAIVLIIVGYLAPFWVGRRQAIVLSREGDRFSGHLRIVCDGSVAEDNAILLKESAGMPLLTSRAKGSQGADMKNQVPKSDAARPRPSTRVRLSPQQAREMARLKSSRASRVSREKSQAQRRFVATIASLVLLVAVIILAGVSVLSWWWLFVPALVFVAVTVISRSAAVRSQKARQAEDKRLKQLCSTFVKVPAQATVRKNPVAAQLASGSEVAVQDPASAEKTVEDAAADLNGSVVEAPVVEVPVVEQSAAEQSAESSDVASKETSQGSGKGWTVSQLPQPTYSREKKIATARVHPDTDIIAVKAPESKVVRPLEPSKVENAISSAEAASSYNLDIEAVLEARRAQ